VPPGTYIVMSGEKLGEEAVFGIVYIKVNWRPINSYDSKFVPLRPKEISGAAWNGHIKLKDKLTAEGSYRYTDTHASGSHKINLIRKGVLKVNIRSDENPGYHQFIYWVKI